MNTNKSLILAVDFGNRLSGFNTAIDSTNCLKIKSCDLFSVFITTVLEEGELDIATSKLLEWLEGSGVIDYVPARVCDLLEFTLHTLLENIKIYLENNGVFNDEQQRFQFEKVKRGTIALIRHT